MTEAARTSTLSDTLAAQARQRDMEHLQAIEDNPLDAEDRAMFAMFEREGWSPERCARHIREQALKAAAPQAAE